MFIKVAVLPLLIFGVQSCNFHVIPRFTTKRIVKIERDRHVFSLCKIYLRTSHDAEVHIKKKKNLAKHGSVEGTVIQEIQFFKKLLALSLS